MNRPTARTVTRPLVASLTITLALVGSALSGTIGATSASAADDPTNGGLWYYSLPQLDTVHQRTTGKGINVAVLDGAINPAAPDLVGVKNLITRPDSFCQDASGAIQPATGTAENAEHATDMASLIVGTGKGAGGQPGTLGVAPGATLRHYSVTLGNDLSCLPDNGKGLAAGINQAVADGAKILSISLSGSTSPDVNDAIGHAERAGVILVVASNNRGGTNLGWPASANGVVSVEGDDVNGQLIRQAVTSPLLSVVAPGDSIRRISWSEGRWDTYILSYGSSFSTAWTAGVLALEWSAYPKATANQIIQTLLRNTRTGNGNLTRNDSWGYGTVTVTTMLAVDPTKYPDVNPLLRKEAAAQPAYAAIVGKATAASTSPATKPATASGPPHLLLIVGGGLIVLVILAAIVLAIVLTRRNRTAPAPAPAVQYRPVP